MRISTAFQLLFSSAALHLTAVLATSPSASSNFSIINGQIFTPGPAIIDSPQPFTPLGGDFLQVAIDVSGNGELPWPPRNDSNIPTQLHNITLFLTSYTLGHNLTISNATDSSGTLPFADILQQESGSTVKHVNWEWPLCMVSNGRPSSEPSARGIYNISIHQSFRLNGSEYYTIFDLPINVSNGIPLNASSKQDGNAPNPGPRQNDTGGRISCSSLENGLVNYTAMMNATQVPATQPYLGGPVLVGNYKGFGAPNDGVAKAQASLGLLVLLLLWGFII